MKALFVAVSTLRATLERLTGHRRRPKYHSFVSRPVAWASCEVMI